MTSPILTPLPIRPPQTQSWGSEGLNPAFGASEAPKRQWSIPSIVYQDVAALERFGVDPLAPPSGRGVVLSANSYGYPIDGYTTGYTVKLPPSGADITVAQQTPISGNQPSVVMSSAGGDGSPITGVPSDEPVADQIAGVDWSNPWKRGEAMRQMEAQKKTAESLANPALTPEQRIALTRYLNNEYGAPPATPPEASDNSRMLRPPAPPPVAADAPGRPVRIKTRAPGQGLRATAAANAAAAAAAATSPSDFASSPATPTPTATPAAAASVTAPAPAPVVAPAPPPPRQKNGGGKKKSPTAPSGGGPSRGGK